MDFCFEIDVTYYVVKIDPEVNGVAILSIISDETNSHIAAAFANATSYTKRGKFKYFSITNIVDVANDPQGTMSEFLTDAHENMTSGSLHNHEHKACKPLEGNLGPLATGNRWPPSPQGYGVNGALYRVPTNH